MRKLAIAVVILAFLCVVALPAAFADDTSLQSSLIVVNGTTYADTLSVPGVFGSTGFGATTSPYGGTSVYGTVTVAVTNTGSSSATLLGRRILRCGAKRTILQRVRECERKCG